MKRSMVFHRGLLETKMEEIPEVTKKLAPFAKKQSRNIIMEKKIRKRYHSEEADKITELYLQQQKFHERVFKTIGGVVTLALGVTVTMLGLKAIGSDEDLPQLDDENQNVA